MLPSSAGAGDRRSKFSSPFFTKVNAFACVVGTCSLTGAVVLYILTLVPGAPILGRDEFLPFFVLAFPLFAWMFCVLSDYGIVETRHRFGTFSARIPRGPDGKSMILSFVARPGRVLVAVCFVLGVAGFFSAFQGGLSGQPAYDALHHQYTLDNHGVITVVSRATYLHAEALLNRLFLGGALVFTSLGTVVAWGEWSRRRQRTGRTGYSWLSP
jgi:hypothetical protein